MRATRVALGLSLVAALAACAVPGDPVSIPRIEDERQPASAELIETLRDPAPALRARAALAMGRIQSDAYTDSLGRGRARRRPRGPAGRAVRAGPDGAGAGRGRGARCGRRSVPRGARRRGSGDRRRRGRSAGQAGRGRGARSAGRARKPAGASRGRAGSVPLPFRSAVARRDQRAAATSGCRGPGLDQSHGRHGPRGASCRRLRPLALRPARGGRGSDRARRRRRRVDTSVRHPGHRQVGASRSRRAAGAGAGTMRASWCAPRRSRRSRRSRHGSTCPHPPRPIGRFTSGPRWPPRWVVPRSQARSRRCETLESDPSTTVRGAAIGALARREATKGGESLARAGSKTRTGASARRPQGRRGICLRSSARCRTRTTACEQPRSARCKTSTERTS